jgi:hypothetical protein
VAVSLPRDANPTTALNAVGGLGMPVIGRGLPTDTLGRYADTTINPSVIKAAHHITVLCARGRRVVISQRRVREQRVIMICYRRAEACAATVCAEATAQRVSIAPSPVSGNPPNSDSTYSTVHITDSRHCASKAAHDHTLVADTHINFSIEDYRKELECKISVSAALKAPVCTLFNVSPGPPFRTPLSVRAPLEPIKGRACSLEREVLLDSQGTLGFSEKARSGLFQALK